MDSFVKEIEQRCSRRRYLQESLETSAVTKLSELIADYNRKGNLKMHLILNNGKAFDGFSKSYGMFSGVLHYIAQVGNKEDVLEMEKLGYYGELLVLHATELGLGTCWVGGTYDKSCCPVELKDGEQIVCAIVVGKADQSLSAKEKLIRWGTHRKTKTIEQMYVSDEPVSEWFLAGMKAVQKAPSAVNRQPVIFTYKDHKVTASVKDITAQAAAIDLGIAKLHFELGTGGGSWKFGNGAEFTRK